MLIWSRRKQFWQICNKKTVVSQKELFRPQCKRLKKIFKKNCFPSNCPSEGVGSSFENLGKVLSPKLRRNYAQSPSMYQTRSKFFGKFCFFRIITEHVEIAFDNPYVQFLGKVRKHFDHNPTKRDRIFSQKFFWSKISSELVEISFDKFAKRNFQKSKKVSLLVRIHVKTKKFVIRLFLHFVSRTRREKFWQPICWSLADSQKKFRLKFGSQTRNCFWKENLFFLQVYSLNL